MIDLHHKDIYCIFTEQMIFVKALSGDPILYKIVFIHALNAIYPIDGTQ